MIYLAYDRINHKNIKAVEALSTNEAAYYLFVDYIAPFYNLDKQLPEDLIQRIVFELYDVMSFQEIRGIQLNERYSSIIFVFPALVWLGASGSTTDKTSTRICKFLGDISFPLYIIHYPFMYLFYAWLIKNEYFTLGETWEVAVCVCAWNVLLAYACLKLYDEPVRKWLSKKYLTKK